MEHGLSAVVMRLQFLLFFLFVSASLALSAVTASAAAHDTPEGKGYSGRFGFPVTGTFVPCITSGALFSLYDLVADAARITATLINGLVTFLHQALGRLF